MDGGVKVFRLVAERVKREFAPGMIVNCWGYNVNAAKGRPSRRWRGDRVHLVNNHVSEPTTVHWHGLIVPNGMDGVSRVASRTKTPVEFILRSTAHNVPSPLG